MTSFKYMSVYSHADHIVLDGTHQNEVVALLEQFKNRPNNFAPQSQYFWDRNIPNLCTLTHLKEDVSMVFMWLLRVLCDDGWEPFAVTLDTELDGRIPGQIFFKGKMHLRKTVTV